MGCSILRKNIFENQLFDLGVSADIKGFYGIVKLFSIQIFNF